MLNIALELRFSNRIVKSLVVQEDKMAQDFFSLLRSSLSDQRFDSYRQSSTDKDIDLLERYLWNIALCESLYPTLQNLEIALRNNIYNAATISFNNPKWFDDPSILDIKEQRNVNEAKYKISNRDKLVTEGRVIAELTFGFWTSLFHSDYDRVFWNQGTLIKNAFPNMPNRIRNRSTLSRRFSALRILRNRVFHHEPIWNNPDLKNRYEDLTEALGWLNPALRDVTKLMLDRFLHTYLEGSKPYREHLDTLLDDFNNAY